MHVDINLLYSFLFSLPLLSCNYFLQTTTSYCHRFLLDLWRSKVKRLLGRVILQYQRSLKYDNKYGNNCLAKIWLQYFAGVYLGMSTTQSNMSVKLEMDYFIVNCSPCYPTQQLVLCRWILLDDLIKDSYRQKQCFQVFSHELFCVVLL
jgi:hypothetical protein